MDSSIAATSSDVFLVASLVMKIIDWASGIWRSAAKRKAEQRIEVRILESEWRVQTLNAQMKAFACGFALGTILIVALWWFASRPALSA